MMFCYSEYRTLTGGAKETARRLFCIRKKYDMGGDGCAESKKP